MADPILTPSQPATLTQSINTAASVPQTTGFSDSAWQQAIESAFSQRDSSAASSAAQPAADNEQEPENPLTPPEKPVEAAKPEPKQSESKTAEAPKEKPKTKSEQWKELHRLRDEAERQRDEWKTKYETAIEDAKRRADPEEVKRLRSERDDYEQRLKAFAVEHDPAFEQQMNTRLNRIKSEADVTLGDNAKRFMSLLELPEGDFKRQQISNAMAEMDEFTKMSAFQLAAKHRDLAMERGEYVKNARENYQKILDTQARQVEAMRNRVMSEFEDTVKQWQDPQRGIPALQMKEGDDAWNSKVRETVDLAKNILTGQLPPQDLIKASLWSASAPRLLESMHALKTQNAELQKQLDALKAATPDATRTGGGDAPMDTDEEYKGLSYGAVVARMAEKAGGFTR